MKKALIIVLMALSFVSGMITVDHKCFTRHFDTTIFTTPTEYFDHLEKLQSYCDYQDSLINYSNKIIKQCKCWFQFDQDKDQLWKNYIKFVTKVDSTSVDINK